MQPQTKQRLAHVLIREVIINICDASNEVIVIIHWQGGQHTEVRVARTRTGRYLDDKRPCPVEAVQKLAEHWDDRQLAVTMNRMRCKSSDGLTWTAVRVRELREKLGVAEFDPNLPREETIGIDETADRLGICSASVRQLIRSGTLPATQLLPAAPWQIPVANLESKDVLIGVREIIARRPRNMATYRDEKTLKLPGIE